jgi:hypothetical protein
LRQRTITTCPPTGAEPASANDGAATGRAGDDDLLAETAELLHRTALLARTL